jgi:hypothetical protein
VYTVASVPGTNYQWTVPTGATITSGLGSNTIIVAYGTSVAGAVGVTGTNVYGSSNESVNISQDITTGLLGTSPQSLNVSVYPNPFSESTQVVSRSKFAFTVYNLIGELIESGAGEDKIAMGDSWPSGTYLIKVQHEDGSYSLTKAVKE